MCEKKAIKDVSQNTRHFLASVLALRVAASSEIWLQAARTDPAAKHRKSEDFFKINVTTLKASNRKQVKSFHNCISGIPLKSCLNLITSLSSVFPQIYG